MNITVKSDGNGFLAEVIEYPSVYAFGYSEREAVEELAHVVEMLGESFVFPIVSKKDGLVTA
jgi:predicted RNase H-like HicB family nuclease